MENKEWILNHVFHRFKSQYTNDFIFELEPNEAASFQDQGIDGSFSLYTIDLHKL